MFRSKLTFPTLITLIVLMVTSCGPATTSAPQATGPQSEQTDSQTLFTIGLNTGTDLASTGFNLPVKSGKSLVCQEDKPGEFHSVGANADANGKYRFVLMLSDDTVTMLEALEQGARQALEDVLCNSNVPADYTGKNDDTLTATAMPVVTVPTEAVTLVCQEDKPGEFHSVGANADANGKYRFVLVLSQEASEMLSLLGQKDRAAAEDALCNTSIPADYDGKGDNTLTATAMPVVTTQTAAITLVCQEDKPGEFHSVGANADANGKYRFVLVLSQEASVTLSLMDQKDRGNAEDALCSGNVPADYTGKGNDTLTATPTVPVVSTTTTSAITLVCQEDQPGQFHSVGANPTANGKYRYTLKLSQEVSLALGSLDKKDRASAEDILCNGNVPADYTGKGNDTATMTPTPTFVADGVTPVVFTVTPIPTICTTGGAGQLVCPGNGNDTVTWPNGTPGLQPSNTPAPSSTPLPVVNTPIPPVRERPAMPQPSDNGTHANHTWSCSFDEVNWVWYACDWYKNP